MLFAVLLTSLGCKKEYVEPFEWYLTGSFNGTDVAFEVDRETDAAVYVGTWQCNALNDNDAWIDCDSGATGLWIEESKFHNYIHAVDTPNLANEISFS